MNKQYLSLISLLLCFAVFTSCINDGSQESGKPLTLVDTVRYELPLMDNRQCEQIIEHIGYVVSYNNERHIPNWVAYELTSEEVEGTVKRKDCFASDPMVVGETVLPEEYKNDLNLDKGHMAPAGDMKWSKQAMAESFYMSNMCPQNRNNNRGDWRELEELARDWAVQYGNVYICCGPIVENEETCIGVNMRIVVPQEFFKVFLRRDGERWYAIGFVMQNIEQSKPLMTYGVSVDEIERRTGIDFFYQLPDSIESRVEADFEFADWTVK